MTRANTTQIFPWIVGIEADNTTENKLAFLSRNFSQCDYVNESGSATVHIARDLYLLPMFYNFTTDFPLWSKFPVKDEIEYYLLMNQCVRRSVSTLSSEQDVMHVAPLTDFELNFSAVPPDQTQGLCVMVPGKKECVLLSPPLRSLAGLDVNMTESYAICDARYDAGNLACQPDGWRNVTFRIDEDPENNATWHNADWLFSSYNFSAECPDGNCCIRLEAKSKRSFVGISTR